MRLLGAPQQRQHAASTSAPLHAPPAPQHRRVRCCVTAPDRAFSLPALHVQSATELDRPAEGFDSIQSALDALRAGEFVVVLDDADRENEGDLIIAADRATPAQVAFMVEHTSGAPPRRRSRPQQRNARAPAPPYAPSFAPPLAASQARAQACCASACRALSATACGCR